jgi:FtsP/CotA-like multicopper oxidase with cupredoxin domain
MDTPVVNGKAYPVLHVAPAAYRFQILSAGNDRSWNLSWFVADPTGKDVAMLQAAPPPANSLPLCGAINPVAVPSLVLGVVTALMDGSGNPMNGTGLPVGCWPNYGPQQGIPAPQTMWAADGRAGGAPDPRTAGPPWIQIGTEGGLLPAPVVIPATPINYEQNTRSITIGSVAMHGLWLGPAERADAIVDFSQFAGKTLILYNDAPTPAPAFDSRLDYFTGDGDQTPIGGAPNTQPGYGPNTRTIMQVVVDGVGGNMVPFNLQTLKAAFASTATTAGLFASTQPTTIIPEAAYNSAYNQTFPNTYASIQANSLTFTPIAPLTLDQPCTPGSTTCANLDQKAIQELFTLDYGRMNATLGVEIPLTTFQNQTTIPYGYVDWPTEIIQDGQTQLWKITHNGVDTHFIHFHLFNVQVVNRVGWDGSMRPPDSNEVGWKDTVRMNPLEDILVALQPIRPSLPFPIRDSIRLMDVTNTPGSISGLDPFSGNATISTANKSINFGWEYVWHCHILGHEENDMMRPIIFQVAPPAPSNLVVATATSPATGISVAFIDKSASETGFNLERSVNDPNFSTPADITAISLLPSSPNTAYGGAITYNDPMPPPGTLYYRVQAVDDFGPQSPLVSPFQTVTLSSPWSNTASIGAFPIAALSPATPLLFGSVSLLSTSGPQTVSLLNNGAVPLGIISIGFTGLNPGDFLQVNTCGTSLAANSSCPITVTFRPTALGTRSAALTINSNDPNNPTLTVSVTGTGIGPVAVVSPTVVSFGNQLVGTTSTVKTVTLSNAGSTGSTLTINSITMGGANPGDFAQTATCGASLASGASCTISVTFKPTVVGGRGAALTINTSDPVNPVVTSQLTGTGTAPVAVVSTTSLAFGNQKQQTTSAPKFVTLSNTGTAPLTITSIAIGGTNAGDFKQTNTCGGSLAAGGNCTISVTFKPTKKGTRTATLTVTDNSNAVANSQQNVSLVGTGQ